jgi:7-carboxy-7-deazaguanine synthase (Cx14CxxC type)
MTYAVKEIYYTLQGEGANAGRPAVFLRFAGCNLWSGLENDRAKGSGGCSMWCDTQFVGTDGPGGGKFRSAETLVAAVVRAWPANAGPASPLVVCTGGEPLLQLDAALVDGLRRAGFSVAAETNGTITPPGGLLWLTVSPKANTTLKVTRGNELKLVYPQSGMDPALFAGLDFKHFYLQPLDGPDRVANTEACVAYCLGHPRWRLSVQTHKMLGIP